MNKITNKIFSLLTIFALTAPAGIFSSPYNTNTKTKTSLTSTFATIKVVYANSNAQQITVSQVKPIILSDCLLNPVAQNNFLQGSSELNLNQPASCFKLSLGESLPFSEAITFAAAQVLPVVKVVTKNNFFEKQSLAKSQQKHADATETVVILGILIAFYALEKSIKYLKNVKPRLVIYRPNVFQLLVLRC